MPAFSQEGEYELPEDHQTLCHNPATIIRSDGNRDDSVLPQIWVPQKKRRSDKESAPRSPIPSRFAEMVVMSHNPTHNATELCKDTWAHGPSFVSFEEGVFCDMEEKIAWPLCTGVDGEKGCYDWKSHSMVESRVKRRVMGYTNVVEWD